MNALHRRTVLYCVLEHTHTHENQASTVWVSVISFARFLTSFPFLWFHPFPPAALVSPACLFLLVLLPAHPPLFILERVLLPAVCLSFSHTSYNVQYYQPSPMRRQFIQLGLFEPFCLFLLLRQSLTMNLIMSGSFMQQSITKLSASVEECH